MRIEIECDNFFLLNNDYLLILVHVLALMAFVAHFPLSRNLTLNYYNRLATAANVPRKV